MHMQSTKSELPFDTSMSLMEKFGGNQAPEQQQKHNQDYEVQQVLNQCGYKQQIEYSPVQVAKIIDTVKSMSAGPVNTLVKEQIQKERTEFELSLEEHCEQLKEKSGPIVRKDYLQGLRTNTSNSPTGTLLTGLSAQLFATLVKQLVQLQKFVTQAAEVDQIFTGLQKEEQEQQKSGNKSSNTVASKQTSNRSDQLTEFEITEKALGRQLKTQQVAQKISSIATDHIQVAKVSKGIQDVKNQLLAQQDINSMKSRTGRQIQHLYNSLSTQRSMSANVMRSSYGKKDQNSQEIGEIVLPGLDFYENISVFRKQIEQYSSNLDNKLKTLGQMQEKISNQLLRMKKYGMDKYYDLLKEHLCSIYNFSRVYDRLATRQAKQLISQRKQLLEHVYETQVNLSGTQGQKYHSQQQQHDHHIYAYQPGMHNQKSDNSNQQITSPNTYYRELQSRSLRTQLDNSVSESDQMGIFFNQFGL